MVKLPRIPRPRLTGWSRLPLLSSVRGRIVAGFGLLVLILVVVVGGSVWQYRGHLSDMAEMEEHSDASKSLESARLEATSAALTLQRYIITGDATQVPEFRSNVAAIVDSLGQARAHLKVTSGGNEKTARLDGALAAIAPLAANAEKIIAMRQDGDVEGAAAILEGAVPPFDQFSLELEDIAEAERKEVTTLRTQSDRTGDLTRWFLILAGVLGGAMGLVVSLITARSVLKPLASLESAALAVSGGDLQARAPATGPRELARLGVSLNQMTESLLDASKRRDLEEALRESEERLQDFLDNATDLIQSVAMDGTFAYVNRAWRQALGYSEEEVRSINLLDIIHPDSKAHCMKLFQHVMAGESLDHVEAVFVTKDGTNIWVEGSAFNRLQDGKPVATRGIFHDVTERKRAEDALRESEARHRTLLEHLPQKIFLKDRDSVYVTCNENYARDLNIRPDEVTGKTDYDFYPKELAEKYRQDDKRVMESGKTEDIEEEYVQDGQRGYVQTVKTPVTDGNGHTVGVLGVFWDITERKRTEQEAQQQHRMREALGTLLQMSLETVSLEQLLGRALDHLVSIDWLALNATGAIFLVEDDPEVLVMKAQRGLGTPLLDSCARVRFGRCLCGQAASSGEITFADRVDDRHETRYEGISPHGHYCVPILSAGRVLGVINLYMKEGHRPDEREEEFLRAAASVLAGIIERKRTEETIQHMAFHDVLTGLPNWALFVNRLDLALAEARRNNTVVAVLMLDMDNFKVVNDSVGHVEGDRLLRIVGERLVSAVRDSDTVARTGGDEFALLLPAISRAEEAAAIAERVLEDCRHPWALDGREFHVGASIGIALYPRDGENGDSLRRNADIAMYRAKAVGGNAYEFFAPIMQAQIEDRLAMEGDLRRALERGEFMVHYQPQLDMDSEHIVGVEALMRWRCPDRGLVSPEEFIPVAEQSGLIVPMGEWVLRNACAQNRAWQEAGLPPMRVAVNMSPRQFQQRDLAEMVARVLEETRLAPEYVDLEITESIVMENVAENVATLRELAGMGINITIDDFGMGHSALAYLKDFPVGALKIDRLFVAGLPTDRSSAAIAAAIINVAHSLNLRVVAEGVETEDQRTFLTQRRCEEFQGYLFSRPVPAEAIGEMLSRIKNPRRKSASRVAT